MCDFFLKIVMQKKLNAHIETQVHFTRESDGRMRKPFFNVINSLSVIISNAFLEYTLYKQTCALQTSIETFFLQNF